MSKQLCNWLQKKTLTLEEKIRVLDHAEKNPKVGYRKLEELFGVGKTKIAALIKDKRTIRAQLSPNVPAGMFSNIKVVFLPPNTTSRLQPLDAGVIKNFKVRYRNFLLKFVVSRVNRGLTAPDIAKEVDVLQAIRWIKQAWDEVPEEIVQKCFDKCGFSNVVQNNARSEEEEDQEFAELVRRISQGETTAEEYVTADQEIPSCATLSKWRQRLRDEALDLYQKESEEPASKVVVVADSDKEGQDVDFEPPAPAIKSTTEALRLVNYLKEFASSTLQDEILVSKLSSVGQRFEDFKLLHLKQSTITDFFPS
ncbi:tigger transposable element-derived protein 6-like [Montipora capricornis]|uniref:tigger transposable element-derived protein 6-like n=1 Tax=Montipora capricornis TaxID=246305 RepID=UPI0035F1B8D3